MRKIESSSNTLRADRLRSRAEARSRPNGFSTITRAFVARPATASASMTVGNKDGGMAR